MKKRLLIWFFAVLTVLTIPLVLTVLGDRVAGNGWNWSAGDFVFAFVLLFGTCAAYELIAQRGGTVAYRAAAGLACATVLLLLWINAAVGIIGDGPVNLLYLLMPVILIVGAIMAKLQPRAMARTLYVAALVQMLIPIVALVVWNPSFTPGVLPVFGLNGFFALLFVGSGLLFQTVRNERVA